MIRVEQLALRRAHRLRRPDHGPADRHRPVIGRDDHRKHAGEGDQQDLREVIDAEPEDEDRHERDLGRGKGERHQGIKRPVRPSRARHQQAREHAEHHGEREPSEGAIEAHQQRSDDLSLEQQNPKLLQHGGDGRQEQRPDQTGARDRLPRCEHEEERIAIAQPRPQDGGLPIGCLRSLSHRRAPREWNRASARRNPSPPATRGRRHRRR